MILIEEKYSYDDVLLVPSISEITPDQANTRVRLAGNIFLNIPILSAAMDTVTEQDMAIAMALRGGAGVIHRNLTPEEQARQVKHVKRYLNWVISAPFTISSQATMKDVKKVMKQHDVRGLPVVDESGILVGIVTGRDMRFVNNDTEIVGSFMTKDVVTVPVGITPEKAYETFGKYRIEKLPVVDESGVLIGLITVKDLQKREENPQASVDESGRLIVGAAISPMDWKIRLPLLVESQCDFVVFDTAHGAAQSVLEAVRAVKQAYPSLPVIGGNVATASTTQALIDAGVDAVKVGVGPGSICTTRVVSGVGYPQFSAVVECAEIANKAGIPCIADGGIKYSGDIAKAIGAGASAVMLGNMLAGLKEAPGDEIIFEGRIFKQYRGMGSLGAINNGSGDRYQMRKEEKPVPEGVEGRVPYKGEASQYLHVLVSGLKKGMGYTGCKDIETLRKYRQFVKITQGGLVESHVHNVNVTKESPNYS
ncbi:IMP dehydrogenase [Entomospira nematocerorum]|uniref:Inosine-5'-monophosphate dehydrogenase n=1 Tax=Entomospira nematocerorum TaxID=2719987 RepID=A0A968GG33_9SPIO|nr:IMP dehydrogenase [Entomospira nematocera]NIZ47171.1 IMP dehydrogenase [Entomospira nematocera]WDI34286.1 IMP dehydrogenase [Entomospira nematocera]